VLYAHLGGQPALNAHLGGQPALNAYSPLFTRTERLHEDRS